MLAYLVYISKRRILQIPIPTTLSIDSASSHPYPPKMYSTATDRHHEISFNEYASYELEKNLTDSLTE
jgi:hypothetical protein